MMSSGARATDDSQQQSDILARPVNSHHEESVSQTKMDGPLHKVVFIQRVAAFVKTPFTNTILAKPESPFTEAAFTKNALSKTHALKGAFQLAYVNNSWNDTIKNYGFHLFERELRQIESDNTLERVCDRVIKCGVLWVLNAVLFSETVLYRINLIKLVCENDVSLAVMQYVVEKIIEVDGGKDLLKGQLSGTDSWGSNCLMYCCGNSSTSPEVLSYIFEKVVEVGGTALLKIQLSASDNSGRTCLMQRCINSSSPEVSNLLFVKIVEVGGREMLKSQLSTTDDDGWNCLIFACKYSSSPEVVIRIFEKILEAGGTEMLKSQLVATTGSRLTCLMEACGNFSCAKIVKQVAVVLYCLDLFKQEYDKLLEGYKSHLKERRYNIESASWVPAAVSVAQARKFLQQGDDAFKRKAEEKTA